MAICRHCGTDVPPHCPPALVPRGFRRTKNTSRRCAECDFFSAKVFGADGVRGGKCFVDFEHPDTPRRVYYISNPHIRVCPRFRPEEPSTE